MDEKTMVNDVLNSVKLELTNYGSIIADTENLELRQIIIQIRNNEESFQYELFKVAKMKGYCNETLFADSIDFQKVRDEIEWQN